VVVGIASLQDHSTLLHGISLHQRACNALLNLDKCETLPLTPTLLHPPIGIILARTSLFTHLGIPFHPQSLSFPPSYFTSLLDPLLLDGKAAASLS
jgi:hypothetical protein